MNTLFGLCVYCDSQVVVGAFSKGETIELTTEWYYAVAYPSYGGFWYLVFFDLGIHWLQPC